MRRSLLLFLMLVCSPTYAENIGVMAVGQFWGYQDPDGLLPFVPAVGAPNVTLTFVFDTGTPDTSASDPKIGEYIGAVSAMNLFIGDERLPPLGGNAIEIRNDFGDGDDRYDYWSIEFNVSSPTLEQRFFVRLWENAYLDGSTSALNSDALVAPPPWPSVWDINDFVYLIEDRTNPSPDEWITLAIAVGDLKSLAMVPAPLPPAVLLFPTAIAAVAWRVRRRVTA